MKKLAFFLLVVPFLLAPKAWAFPEMVRHGYPSCATCHTSPDGGGILTDYGRVLSSELLSTWSSGENEGKFLYGVVTPPSWISFNGDVRFVETYRKAGAAPAATSLIFMQADLETSVRYQKFEAVATLGYQDDQGGTFPDFLISRRHYGIYRPTENVSVRAGRFQTAYGIRTPDHVLEIKRGLGWDERSETYNLEGYYLGEGYEVFATGTAGRPDIDTPDVEKGFAFRGAYFVKDRSKLGLSYYFGSNSAANRHVYGPYAILGITPKMILMVEADLQHLMASGVPTETGLYTYTRFSYEVVRGLLPFVTQEIGLDDLSQRGGRFRYTYGLGVQWYPRPHFDFQLIYQKQNRAPGGDANYGWLMMHAYL